MHLFKTQSNIIHSNFLLKVSSFLNLLLTSFYGDAEIYYKIFCPTKETISRLSKASLKGLQRYSKKSLFQVFRKFLKPFQVNLPFLYATSFRMFSWGIDKNTLRKVSKYGFFSGPYFPVFRPEKTPY